MNALASSKRYLTPTEVAELLMVSPITVRQWAQKGELAAMTTPGGHRRFRHEDLVRFARQRGLALAMPDDTNLRILIVDDDKPFGFFLGTLFDTLPTPPDWQCAHDGFEAGRQVLTFRPHVMLLDLMMPGLNGFEVCQRIKDDPSTAATRIIAMTGYFSPENDQRIRAAGAEICLAKPFDKQALLDAIGIGDMQAALQT